jgi:PKD repeat protein
VTVTGPTPCTITAAWTYQVSHGDSFSFTASDTNSAAHHIWNLGDGTLISSSTQVNHVYGSSGSYAVCFYVYIPGTNCSDSSCQTVNVLLGINELSQSLPNITIMPNPFSQYTVIKVDGAVQAYEMNVYDVVGKVIRHESSSTNTFNTERGNLASGIYIYEVTLQGTTIGKGKMIAE